MLDLGCGVGHSSHAVSLLSPSSYVIGVDISAVAAKRGKELYTSNPSLDFVVADVTKLPVRPNSVDLAISMFVYEHLEAPVVMLKEIHRVLREGAVILTTDNRAIVRRDKWVDLKDETHVSLTTPEQVKANLRKIGFDVIRCITHGFPILNTLEKVVNKILDAPLGLGAEIIVVAEKR